MDRRKFLTVSATTFLGAGLGLFAQDRKKDSNSDRQKIKIVLLGDRIVGKTSLATVLSGLSFPESTPEGAIKPLDRLYELRNKKYKLELFDTDEKMFKNAALVDKTKVAKGAPESVLSGADVVLVCFSYLSAKNFENVRTKWDKIVQLEANKATRILVGTKYDLSKDPQAVAAVNSKNRFDPLIPEAWARENKYYFSVCSAMDGTGCNELAERICWESKR